MNNLYFERIKEYGLDVPNNLKGDLRETLQFFFSPIIDGTELSFKINTSDQKGKILEIHKTGYKGRIGGIKALNNMEYWIFLSKDIFYTAKERLGLPDNMQKTRSQPHIKVSLETIWNILCFLSMKTNLMTLFTSTLAV